MITVLQFQDFRPVVAGYDTNCATTTISNLCVLCCKYSPVLCIGGFAVAEWKHERSRLWNCLLYPDNTEHMEALERIHASEDINWVSIMHDSDTDENGNLKKPHYHLILKFQNPRENYAIASKLGIQVNYLEKTQSWKNSAKYLLHADCEDKFLYSADKLEGPLASKVVKLLESSRDEGDAAVAIIDLMESFAGYLPTAVFLRLLCKKHLYSYYRRSAYTFLKLLEEHNSRYSDVHEEQSGKRDDVDA